MADSPTPDRPGMSGIRHELPILITVLGTAVVLGIVVSLLPILGRTAPEESAGAAQYLKAHAAEKESRAKAIDLYAAIKPEAGEWYERAQSQLARLRAEAAREPPKPSPKEQADYDAYVEFWRTHAGDYDELIRQGEAFVMAHPRGELRPDVENRIAQARRTRSDRRLQEAQDVEASIARYLERKDFGGAILAIEKVSERLRPELDVWPRLAAKRDSIFADARRHYQKQLEEANRLVKEGFKDDARRLWYSTMRSFGDGKVPELVDLHKAATLRAEEIR